MKTLYIFPGSRKAPTEGVSDTQLYGFNHLAAFGIDASSVARDDALPLSLRQGVLGKRIGFKLRQALLFFTARKYDLVFGPTLLYLMLFKKILGGRAKYVVLNIELNRILRGSKGRPFRAWFIKSLFKEFSGIVCLSTDQKEWLIEHHPFLEGKVFFVPLGADTEFFQPVYEGRNDVVLSVGRDNGRDYRTFLDAAAQMPETKFEIVCSPRNLVGIGSIPSNVRVQYDLSPSELRTKYQTARMIVISTHDDTSTLGADCSGQTVLLDAMASGLPVIMTRKEYISDYVRDGRDVLIVEPYSPAQIVAAIEHLQGDGMLSSSLAKSSRDRAEHEFSTRATAERLSHIFKTIWTS